MLKPLRWIAPLLALSLAVPAVADEATNADLLARFEALQKKVEQQEQRLAEMEAGQASENRQNLLDALKGFEDPNTLRVYYDNGIRLDSLNGWFKLRIGGRIQFDMGWSSDDDEAVLENQQDWFEMRRARMYMAGDIWKNVKFRLEVDLQDGNLTTEDAYIEIVSDGIQIAEDIIDGVRVGHFKEPFSLQELTSSNYVSFIERGIAVDLFAPGRNPGAMVHKYWQECQAGYAFGVFKEANDSLAVSDGGYNLTGRVTWAPWYEDNGKKLVHVGGSYSYRHYGDDEGTVSYTSRGEQNQGNLFLDTTAIEPESGNLIGAEAAMVWGPFSVQGEYLAAALEEIEEQQDLCFNSFYVQGSYFLTGENRVYENGVFTRVMPKDNFDPENNTWGAFEVVARWSYADIDDGDLKTIAGADPGDVHAATIGLNWYLNPNTRIMFNYIRSCWDVAENTADNRAAWDEDVDTFLVRLQVDW